MHILTAAKFFPDNLSQCKFDEYCFLKAKDEWHYYKDRYFFLESVSALKTGEELFRNALEGRNSHLGKFTIVS